ncbi:hypothetical protein [uncultured Salegentibacter sp.]|uniref:hypothetical protein n=1 Tax=uncultured Salegentibacter sp. TaxID=259320 RepID=UPI0025927FC6|nr:hypothetical protein [uncultured Salegentibacter sp.]
MSTSTKKHLEDLIEELEANVKVTVVDEETTEKIFNEIEGDIEEYRFENQQRIKDSQKEMADFVFTA